jgi:hypothetical protein
MNEKQLDVELIQAAGALRIEAHQALVAQLTADEQALLIGRDCLRIFGELLEGLARPGPSYRAEEAREALRGQMAEVRALLARMRLPLAV